jgi:BarA-like signal transduction histidine kinase
MVGQVLFGVAFLVAGHGYDLVADHAPLSEEGRFGFHHERFVEPVGIPDFLFVGLPDHQSTDGSLDGQRWPLSSKSLRRTPV